MKGWTLVRLKICFPSTQRNSKRATFQVQANVFPLEADGSFVFQTQRHIHENASVPFLLNAIMHTVQSKLNVVHNGGRRGHLWQKPPSAVHTNCDHKSLPSKPGCLSAMSLSRLHATGSAPWSSILRASAFRWAISGFQENVGLNQMPSMSIRLCRRWTMTGL